MKLQSVVQISLDNGSPLPEDLTKIIVNNGFNVVQNDDGQVYLCNFEFSEIPKLVKIVGDLEVRDLSENSQESIMGVYLSMF